MLAGLHFGRNVGGMENVLIWHFEKHMGYQILNLCKIVYVYHNHCIHIKLAHYKRYNNDGKSGLAHFFYTLF